MENETKKPRCIKYNAFERKRIIERLRHLLEAKNSTDDCTRILTEEGFKKADGTTLDRTYVLQLCYQIVGRERKPAPTKAPVPSAGSEDGFKQFVLSVITDPKLSEGQIVRIIKAYLEL